MYSSSSTPSAGQPTSQTEQFPWFAVRVKSNFEKRVALSLSGKGLDTFLPEYKAQRRWSDRFKTIDCPLFPGYVFCRIDLNHRLPVFTTPGILYIVSTGNTPTPVDDAEIAGIQLVVRSGRPALPWPSLAAGQRVRIESGPLSGLEGTLLHVANQRRICVAVTLLRRGVSVEIDREWILPIPAARGAESNPKTFPLPNTRRPQSTAALRAGIN